VRVELPASIELVDRVAETAERLVRSRGACEEDAFAVRVALQEALANAIRHGCRQDAGRHVRLTLRMSRQHVRMLVADPGPGFDPDAVPDPLAEPNLSRRGGRGVFYMRRYLDRVSFWSPRAGGTAVSMIKLLRPAGAPLPARAMGERPRRR
jgi:serine/threonine-protein kinase RsbW